MIWKGASVLVLMTSPMRSVGQWLVAMGRQRAGILMVLAYTAAIFSGGAASILWWSDFKTWGNRIASLEEQVDAHEAEVSEPGMARIERLEQRQDDFRQQWEREWNLDAGGRLAVQAEMVRQLYCGEWPDRCERVPRDDEDNP